MKKKYRAALAVGLCMGILAGCQQTPENSIVKQKNADNIKKYETSKGSIQEMVQAPERYVNKASYEDGVLVIDTDAEVIVPEVEAVHTYKVSAQEANQELIDKVTKIFFEGDKIYHTYSYDEITKSWYQEEITRLKKYKAEGNMDPYEYGTDENGELHFNIDEVIAFDEEKMADAPDEVQKIEVKPMFGLEWESGKGEETEKIVDETEFRGVVETSQGIYNYNIMDETNTKDLKISIEKRRDDLPDPRMFSIWTEARFLMDMEGEGSSPISEDTIKKLLGISYEDAEQAAKEKIEQLGWDWQMTDWDYSVFRYGEGDIKEESLLDGGYIFYFSRVIDGVPITFTDSYGGALEDMDSTVTPWSYERCEVIVGDDGIQKVEIYNPYVMDGIQTEHVKLMDFDSIIKIYEQMMEVSNAEVTEFEKQRTYHITRAQLGYSRVYDPNADNTSGILVPVWDFFGGFDSEIDGYVRKNTGEHSKQSFMTINAIDGTVIDRDLGY